jgi:hypothetical protein
MTAARLAERAYWPCWFVSAALTGIVAGFMLGHALILGRFLEWMLAAGPPALLSQTYAVFRAGPGRAGLDAYYAVAGLQALSALAFLLVALAAGRHRTAGVVAGLAGVLWLAVHYGSGFAALEAAVLRSPSAVSLDLAGRFTAWNTPIHLFHAVALAAGLAALLSVPLSALKGSAPPSSGR